MRAVMYQDGFKNFQSTDNNLNYYYFVYDRYAIIVLFLLVSKKILCICFYI